MGVYDPAEECAADILQPIIWDDQQFDVGHPLLNQQHRQLITLINEMIEVVHQQSSSESNLVYLYQRFYKLFDAHLEREEQLLRDSDYPLYDAHKEEHDRYLDTVTEFIIDGFEQPETEKKLMRFLASWWNEHILEHDMQYKPHFTRK